MNDLEPRQRQSISSVRPGWLRCRSPARRKTCDAHLYYSLPALSWISLDQADAMMLPHKVAAKNAITPPNIPPARAGLAFPQSPGTARSGAKAQETAKQRSPTWQ